MPKEKQRQSGRRRPSGKKYVWPSGKSGQVAKSILPVASIKYASGTRYCQCHKLNMQVARGIASGIDQVQMAQNVPAASAKTHRHYKVDNGAKKPIIAEKLPAAWRDAYGTG